MPQLFSLISLYQDKHPNEPASLCTMISSDESSNSNSTSLSEKFVLEDCIPVSILSVLLVTLNWIDKYRNDKAVISTDFNYFL